MFTTANWSGVRPEEGADLASTSARKTPKSSLHNFKVALRSRVLRTETLALHRLILEKIVAVVTLCLAHLHSDAQEISLNRLSRDVS